MKIRLSLQYKILAFLLPSTILVLGFIIGFISIKHHKQMLESTKRQANTELEKYASLIQSTIEQDFSIARGIAYSLMNYNEFKDTKNRDVFFLKTLKNAISLNPNYTAFWLSSELQYIDSNFTNKPGRTRYQFYRNSSGGIEYKNDSLDFNVTNIVKEGSYQQIKQTRQEILIEPYWFSYTGNANDQILETSVCVPILQNNNFIGLTGADIKLDKFKEWLDNINIGENSYMFLMSNKGMIISFPNKENIGKNIKEVFPQLNEEYAIEGLIKSGQAISFTNYDPQSQSKGYFSFQPLVLGKANNPWSIGIFIPQTAIINDARATLFISLILGVLGIIFIVISLIWLIAKYIKTPLKSTTLVLEQLAVGNVSVNKLNNGSGDEIEDMSKSVNQLIDGLNNAASFAKEIGNGNLDISFNKAGDDDMLGKSLLDMQQKLNLAKADDLKRKAKDQELNWATEGMAIFGDILRLNNTNISELTNKLLSKLTDYVDAVQCGLFVRNDANDDEILFELAGSIAYDRIKNNTKSFRLGESLVGRCAYEELTIYMEQVPENYVNITSGLGKSNPRSVLLVPAKLNNQIFAVIEIISFNNFKPYQIDFIEKLGESIASTLANVKTAERTNQLLEQSKQQSEELAAQEEEMRQNLEELQATQEEVTRMREEERIKNEAAILEVEKNRTALTKIIDQVPSKVYLKDAECKILLANNSTLKAMNLSLKEVVGKSDLDLLSDKKAAKASIEEDKRIIEGGKPVTRTNIEMINNKAVVLETTKTPFFIDYLNETGLLCIQVDISKIMDKEDEIMNLKSTIKELLTKKLEG